MGAWRLGFVLVLSVVAGSSWGGAQALPAEPTLLLTRDGHWFNATTQSPAGIAVFNLSGPDPIDFGSGYILSYDPTENHPIALVFISPNGTPQPLNAGFDGYDGASVVAGSGGAYASLASARVTPLEGSPARPNTTTIGWGTHTTSTDGQLVLAWSDQPGPFTFVSYFTGNTSVELSGSSTMVSQFESASYPGVASAGVGPAARIQIAGSRYSPATPGERQFIFVKYHKGELVGKGQIGVETPGHDVRVSLDAIPNATASCICIRDGRIIAATTGAARVNFEYVGEGRTQVWGMIAKVPADLQFNGLSTWSVERDFT